MNASAANPVSKVGISSTDVRGRSRDTNRRGDKGPRSGKSVPQCYRVRNGYKKLPDSSPPRGKNGVPGTRKSRLRDSGRIHYARSSASINGQLRSERVSSYIANVTEACYKVGNPLFSFESINNYLECHFAGLLNSESLMGDGIAKHIYES